MTSRIFQIIERLAQLLSGLKPVPVPVTRDENVPPHIRRALSNLENRYERGGISAAEYARQIRRLTGR